MYTNAFVDVIMILNENENNSFAEILLKCLKI